MKKIIFISLGFIFLTLMSIQLSEREAISEKSSGILFYEGTLDEAFKLAKKENKLVFIDVYATWCRPCKMLKRNTFSDKKIGEFYNKNFINVEIDAEKGEGKEIAAKYNVRAYPTLLFVNPDGTVVHIKRKRIFYNLEMRW
jgi:thioredoxin 1